MVVPTGTYRPFINDPPVNNAEIFDGNLDTEVLGYTFTGDASAIGDGSILGVHNIPEPGSLIIWGLLGAGCAGGAAWRRRRRGATGAPWSEENRQVIRQIVDCGRLNN